MSINNISFANFQTLVSTNFPIFINNLSPASIQLMILAIGSAFITDILTPPQVQSMILYASFQQLQSICMAFTPQSDYRTQGSLLKMNLTQLQNFVQNLTQLQVIAMVQKIILLSIDDFKNLIKSIPPTQLQTIILSLTTNQQAILQKKILLLPFTQCYQLLQSMQLFESYDATIGVC